MKLDKLEEEMIRILEQQYQKANAKKLTKK